MDKDSKLTSAELATLVSTLADEYNVTMPTIIQKLDMVSGDLIALHRLMSGDRTVEWSRDEDDMLTKNPDLLIRWKGQESTDLRKRYNQFKAK